jgi:hypothetical protein
MTASDRLARLHALLADEGIVPGGIRAGGPDGEIAIVRGVALERLQAISARVRALGFRYVGLDLAALNEDD